MANKKFNKLDAILDNEPEASTITQVDQIHQTAPPAELPKGYTYRNGKLIETRSQHLHILIKASTYTALKAKAKADGCSTNDLINQILEKNI